MNYPLFLGRASSFDFYTPVMVAFFHRLLPFVVPGSILIFSVLIRLYISLVFAGNVFFLALRLFLDTRTYCLNFSSLFLQYLSSIRFTSFRTCFLPYHITRCNMYILFTPLYTPLDSVVLLLLLCSFFLRLFVCIYFRQISFLLYMHAIFIYTFTVRAPFPVYFRFIYIFFPFSYIFIRYSTIRYVATYRVIFFLPFSNVISQCY